jgi:hypothetical protein
MYSAVLDQVNEGAMELAYKRWEIQTKLLLEILVGNLDPGNEDRYRAKRCH